MRVAFQLDVRRALGKFTQALLDNLIITWYMCSASLSDLIGQ